MKHDPKQQEMENWIEEIESIAKRSDLTDDEKNALISAKLREYRQYPYIQTPVDREQKPSVPRRGENAAQDQEMEARRARFDQALREGGIRIRPLVEE